jgi:hypothetical protein
MLTCRKQFALTVLTGLLALGLTTCATERARTPPGEPVSPPTSPPPARARPSWDGRVDQFIETYFGANPDFAVWAGRHEYDGKLPDFSGRGLRGEVIRLREWRNIVAGLDATGLDEPRRLEREVLLWWINSDLFWQDTLNWPQRNPAWYGWRLSPTAYLTREYAPLEQRIRAYTNYARAISTRGPLLYFKPLPRTYIEIGQLIFGGLATYYENDVPVVFAAVEDPQLQAEFSAANQDAIARMKSLAAGLEQRLPQATDDFALGRERFLEMLRVTELLDIPLDRLEEIGRQDLERNTDALRAACATLAPDETVAACVALVRSHKPKEGPVAAARRQLTVLKRFIQEHQLVTIPGEEDVRVAVAPPFMRDNWAAVDPPGPFDKHLATYYWVTPPDPNWSEAEQAAYIPDEGMLLFTSLHEVWPGHFLQFQHANRCTSRLGQLTQSYTCSEGWAHYAEEMMWDAGLGNGDPEAHMAQLLMALIRNVRFACAIGLHTQGMTVAEAEKMFREVAFLDPANARQQAARGTYDPGYLNYTLGKLMIRKLRDDWCGPRGGRAAWREFHDRLLSYGAVPLPLIRRAMLGPGAGPPL